MPVPVVPVETVVVVVPFGNVPPPDVRLSVTFTFAGWLLESVAVTVTVDCVPGAPLPGDMLTLTVPVSRAA